MYKILEKLKTNFWKIFVQMIVNTFFIILILTLVDSKSIATQFIGMFLLGYVVRGSLVNITNNKYLILDSKDMPKDTKMKK